MRFEKNRTSNFKKFRKKALSKLKIILFSEGKKKMCPSFMPFLKRKVENIRNTIIILIFFSLLFPSLYPFSIQAKPEKSTLSMENYSTNFEEEKIDFLLGRNDSAIVKLEHTGGSVLLPLDLTTLKYRYVDKITLVVAKQSEYAHVWENPLWQFPDGLSIIIQIDSTSPSIVDSIQNEVKEDIFEAYNIHLFKFNEKITVQEKTIIGLIGSISEAKTLQTYADMFSTNAVREDGNIEGVFYEHIKNNSMIYAFGCTITMGKNRETTKLSRSAIISILGKIEQEIEKKTFTISNVLGEKIVPKASSLISKVTLKIPFYGNITNVSPVPDNVAAQLTGNFEWVLKTTGFQRDGAFDANLSYIPGEKNIQNYPKVQVNNFYSDSLLNEEGVLNMTYTAENIGDKDAINTTIRFPMPEELDQLITKDEIITVMKDGINVDPDVSSNLTLIINVDSDTYSYKYDGEFRILDIEGWYKSNDTLFRWDKSTSNMELVQDDSINVSLSCSNGLPSDFAEGLETSVIPWIEEQTEDLAAFIVNFEQNMDELLTKLFETTNYTYQTVFDSVYENKPIFQYDSEDFEYYAGTYQTYLEVLIPRLKVNETKTITWSLSNIPTINDEFGVFTLFGRKSEENDYLVFRTVKSDYKTLMQVNFAKNNITGRYLSKYNKEIEKFISIGSRYRYLDENGYEYFGLTNGLNLQLADDEAIIHSKLTINETMYTIGDQVNFNIQLANSGTITATGIRIDIKNIKLDYKWEPIESKVIKTLSLEQLDAGDAINYTFTLRANSHLGLNSYMAYISFTSEEGQEPIEVTNPWDQETYTWVYGGEAEHIVTSTLALGLLIPDQVSEQIGSSFPLPEIRVSYGIEQMDNTVKLEYSITNEGESNTSVTVSQIFSKLNFADILNMYCTFNGVNNNNSEQIIPVNTTLSDGSIHVQYISNYELLPNDSISIKIKMKTYEEDIEITPLIVEYVSLYEILETDFSSDKENEVFNPSLCLRVDIKSITESSQSSYGWTVFSSTIIIKPSSDLEDFTIVRDTLPMIYPIFSSLLITGIVVLVATISITRRLLMKKYD